MIMTETGKALSIDKKEVLYYLGYGNQSADEKVLEIIEECILQMRAKLSLKACFDKYILSTDEEGQLCFGSIKTSSESLKKNLSFCDEIILFAATIGVTADRIIQKHSMLSPSYAVIAQAVGTAFIEKWCDVLCEKFGQNEKKTGGVLHPRFSPGYGDFPLEMQKEIFLMLDCPRKIGVSLTEGLLMTPSKSVSAIVGIERTKEIL